LFTLRLALPIMTWISSAAENHTIEFAILALLLLILGLIRQREYARLALFLRSFNNSSLVSQQVREEKAFNRIAIPIFFFVVFVMSYFFSKALQHFHLLQEWSFFSLFFAVCSAVLVITGIRASVYFALSLLFDLNYIHRAHSFHWLLNNFILSLIILCLNVVYTFGPEFLNNILIYCGLVLSGALYLVRTFRIFTLFLGEGRVPLFYNVLYLCALEFLPPILAITAVFRAAQG
jgi:hypothetical protein